MGVGMQTKNQPTAVVAEGWVPTHMCVHAHVSCGLAWVMEVGPGKPLC